MQSIGIGLLVVVLSSGVAHAFTRSAPPTRQDAAVVVDAGRVAPSAGTVVRCAKGQRVGAWVGAGQSLQGVTIAGCEIPVVQEGAGEVTALTVETTTTTCLAGILLFGTGARVTENQIFGCRFSIVVASDSNSVERNRAFQPEEDGILVFGNRNSIRGNTVDGHGRQGIHVVITIPQTGVGQFLPAFRIPTRHNGIVGNTVTNGRGQVTDGAYDLRQWPVSCPASGNTWLRNLFQTKSAPCLG